MGMDKAFASLSSGLLARKGGARPAMRPQIYTPQPKDEGSLEDLGWNDMGDDAMPRERIDVRLPASLSGAGAADAPAPKPAVVQQQEEIAREFAGVAAPAPVAASPKPRRKAKPSPVRAKAEAVLREGTAGRKAAFTLRLNAERHLRLRLACAVEHRSAQQIVIEALDRLLAEMPEVERLAASLPPAGKA